MQIHDHDKIKTNIQPPNLAMSTPLIFLCRSPTSSCHNITLPWTTHSFQCRRMSPRKPCRCTCVRHKHTNPPAMVAMATYTGLRISRSLPPPAASTSHGFYRHCDLHISWSLPLMHHHCYPHHWVIVAPCLRRARHMPAAANFTMDAQLSIVVFLDA